MSYSSLRTIFPQGEKCSTWNILKESRVSVPRGTFRLSKDV